MINLIYVIEILVLCVDIYMVYRARQALNGLFISMIALLTFLIVRRLDDMGRNADDLGILVLSSVVVIIITFDIFKVYKEREVYALYLRNRQTRIEELEQMRNSKAW
jgi:hypothetical protein